MASDISPATDDVTDKPKTQEKKQPKVLAAAGLLVLAAVFAAFVWVMHYASALPPGGLARDAGQKIYIPPKSSFRAIKKLLVDEQIIADDWRFGALARVMGVTNSLKAGEYVFSQPITPFQLLKKLSRGDFVKRSVTIPEGKDLQAIADILAAEKLIARNKFLALCRDKAFIKSLGIKADSLEGYLFPDTYHFLRGASTREIIKTMVARLERVYKELRQNLKTQPELTFHQVLTLASIVEKETAVSAERPLIARVFLNRLARGMRLQTDPTVIYGIEDFDGNLTKKDLQTPSPYNTYMIEGLPPGPIASPGKASIEAVLSPAEGKYLYFVSKNDGTHHFSRTLKEHNRAVKKYQKKGLRR